MKKWVKKSYCWHIIRYNGPSQSNHQFLIKRDRTIIIKRINKVYGGPTLFVFHYRHLRLKLTAEDLFE